MKKSDEDWAIKKDARVKYLEAQNADMRRQLGMVQDYLAEAKEAPKWVTSPKLKHHAALAVAQFSDTHFDEKVDPREMNGLNAYSREIATSRLQRWSHKVCEMIWLLGREFKWQGLALLCSGDVFSGNIHPELKRTNQAHIPESLDYWVPTVAAAFGQIRDEVKKVKTAGGIYASCIVGNHGRLENKPEFKGRARNNYDWLFYKLVKSHFDGDDFIEWDIADAAYTFVALPSGEWIHHSHGDEERMGSTKATAGVMQPLGRIKVNAIKRGQTHGKRIAYAACGHWHQAIHAQSWGAMCNGTMKGFDEFALGCSFEPEPPSQNFCVETAEKGTVDARSLFVCDRKKEGW